MALTTYLDLVLRGTHTKLIDLETATTPFNFDWGDTLTDGTGAVDTADLKWSDTRTLNATSENLDLAGGLTDIYGNTLTFARVKTLIIRNKSTTVGHLLSVGGHATAAFLLFAAANDVDTIGPGGIRVYHEPSAAAKAVTPTTGDLLKIETSHNFSYDIVIIGASA